jgi:hypothetical protein
MQRLFSVHGSWELQVLQFGNKGYEKNNKVNKVMTFLFIFLLRLS